jgi:hypothetical protein
MELASGIAILSVLFGYLGWRLNNQKYELERIREGASLRDRIQERYSRAVELGVQHREASEADKRIIESRVKALMDDVLSFEQTLAKLEDREPRKFPVPLPPSAAFNLRIE